MADKSAAANSTGWPKWQIAVAVGTPVLLGLGFWYYQSSRKGRQNRDIRRKPSSSIEGLDGDVPTSSRFIKPTRSVKETSNDFVSVDSSGSLEDKAEASKIKGNHFFKEGKYEDAIKCYSEAIALCPTDKPISIATFHQNRAAAYEKLKDYSRVISDCSKALELNKEYTKALNRRSKAYEHQLELEKALQDATTLCILEQFQNQSSLILADRVLKQLGQQRAKEAIKNHKIISPSKHFVKTYFSSFAEDPILNFSSEIHAANDDQLSGFLKAHRDVLNENYDNVVEDCSKDASDPQSQYRAHALLLRATFYILRGQSDLAFQDMETLLRMPDADAKIKVNVLIKLASLKVQHQNVEEALQNFKTAEEIDPNNADIFHHRGQVNLLLEKMEDAVQDFKKATELHPDFAVAAVQKCYADYRSAYLKHDSRLLEQTMDAFKATIEKFPRCAEGYMLYAQALVDQQMFEKADKYYNKALKEDLYNANIYVHKGLLLLNWKQDFVEAINLMKTATEKDDRCEFAYETLGALEVQRGNLEHALELFEKAISLARTEPELAHLFSLRDAAAAQQQVSKRLGIPLNQFTM